MYGMIHKAIHQMVSDREEPGLWERISERAGVGPQHMLSASAYDDAITLAIIGACCEELNLQADALLEDFGRYWIGYASQGSYARLMAMPGSDLKTFIDNLDRLHLSVQAAMPESRLPSFTVLESAPGQLSVLYSSERSGLESFVRGLFLGLIAYFGLEGEVAISGSSNSGVTYDVRYRAA